MRFPFPCSRSWIMVSPGEENIAISHQFLPCVQAGMVKKITYQHPTPTQGRRSNLGAACKEYLELTNHSYPSSCVRRSFHTGKIKPKRVGASNYPTLFQCTLTEQGCHLSLWEKQPQNDALSSSFQGESSCKNEELYTCLKGLSLLGAEYGEFFA